MDDTAKPAGSGRTELANSNFATSRASTIGNGADRTAAKSASSQGTVPLGQIFGYARISRGDSQDLRRQLDALTDAGCTQIFSDEISGGKAAESRPGFAEALTYLRPSDVLASVSLDRMSRSLKDLMATVDDLVEQRGVTLRILNLGDLDMRSPMTRILVQVLGAVAELERAMISERTKSGLAASRRRGVKSGRPPALTGEQIAGVKAMRDTGSSAVAAGRAFGVSERTVRRVCSQDFNGR